MVYQFGNRRLLVISSLYRGQVNDVHVCCEEGAAIKSHLLLLVIKDRQTARTVVEMEAGRGGEMPYLESFPWQDKYCLLFEYRSPRPVREFLVGNPDLGKGERWEKLALGIVLRCMEESVRSHAFLFLLLKQEQIHMGVDGRIYVNYCLDLEGLDPEVGEGACVCACAEFLGGLMRELYCGSNPELILRKADRRTYRNFRELYQDVRLICSPKNRPGMAARVKAWGYRRQEQGFRLLAVLCFFLAAVALVTLVSQLATGDVAWFRLLFHTFERIGTETLR